MSAGYTIRANSRARRINITVRRDGSVFVSKPRWVSARAVEHFIQRSARWIERAKARIAELPKTSKIESSKKECKKYKKVALDLVKDRLRHFNVHYRLTYAKISIRNQKSRWGSCSQTGNLSFNYRIILLPPHLADYVIVHELCHLQEKNHGKRFWALVAETVLDCKERRKELRIRSYTLLAR